MIETPVPGRGDAEPHRAVRRPSMTLAQATVLRAFCLWTVWVWGTRIWNILGDDTRSSGFKVVHAVIAVVSVAFAVAAWVVVHRLRSTRGTGPSATGNG